jgi:hypothetical protein
LRGAELGGTIYGVKKTTVYLDESVDRAIGRLAHAQGITKAEAIRRALAVAAKRADRPRITAIGVGHGPGDVADHVERHLSDTDFGTS